MTFKGGQPVMDGGLENYAIISLGTLPGWWGNIFTTDPNKKIGSNFSRPRVHIDVKTVNDTSDDAKLALKAMTDSRIASKIDVSVTNPRADEIRTAITIYPPGQDVRTLIFTRNGINWLSQALDPAHGRLPNVI